jgi:hypothetical protein
MAKRSCEGRKLLPENVVTLDQSKLFKYKGHRQIFQVRKIKGKKYPCILFENDEI